MSPGEEDPLLTAEHGAGPWNQGKPEGDPEKWHLRFRAFSWEGSDPVGELQQLSELCHRWLRPDLHSKEQILDQLVLEQLVISAPEDLQVQIRESGVRSCRDLEELLRGHGRPVQSSIVVYEGQKFLMRDADVEMADAEASEPGTVVDLSPRCRSVEGSALPHGSLVSPQPPDLAGTEEPSGAQCEAVPPETTPEEGEQGPPQEMSAQQSPEPVLPPAPGPAWTQDDQEPQDGDTATANGAAGPAATCAPETGGCAERAPEGDPPGTRSPPRRSAGRALSPGGPQGGPGCPEERGGLHTEATPGSPTPALPGPGQATPSAPHRCGVCSKTFQYPSQLVIHSRSHTGERPFRCDECDKGFMQLSDLRVHQRIHTGERPFRCRLCPKAFTHESTLLGHLRTHTREQPYVCEHCGKGFSHRGNLNVHTRIHTQAKPYPCPVCGHTFRQLGTMRRHCKTHMRTGPPDVPAGPRAEPQDTA
ncbi:PREDICTED: zinc finger and SCAN domain-containing protein 5B [Chinchilla lanigera]|uniref:zinc finger and SCAN domain-containing protein 5B n=1 Tax=Chinchilla lanigera TaxID=34839 RepID=UPI000698C168|nr:PREDICTED: zinc finger and SCAN domain-containing protein 5B [Chinchilla lanigera]